MTDNQPVEPQVPGQLPRMGPRIRYLPDWEIPMNPPKRPLLSRTKISRSIRRSRLAVALRPKPNFVAASHPTSNTSFQNTKESFVDTRGSSTAPGLSSPPYSPHHASIHSRSHPKYLCNLTRRALILIALAILLALSLSLGLGLGLGHRQSSKGAGLALPGTDPALPGPSPGPPGPETATPGPEPAPPGPSPTLPGPAPALPKPDPHVYKGNMTWFSPGLGACGRVSSDTDAVCAVPQGIFDAASPTFSSGGNPKTNPLCGRMIRVTYDFIDAGGTRRQVSGDVTVVDRCADCGPTDLDLSRGAFKLLDSEGSGRVIGKWQFL